MKKGIIKNLTVIAAFTSLLGVAAYQHSELNTIKQEKTVQADKNRTHNIIVGDTYQLHGLKVKISEYSYKGKRNYIINTNVDKRIKFDVGANEKNGKARGVIVSFGNDQ